MSYPTTFRELFQRTGYHDTDSWQSVDDAGVLTIHHGAHSWRIGLADVPDDVRLAELARQLVPYLRDELRRQGDA